MLSSWARIPTAAFIYVGILRSIVRMVAKGRGGKGNLVFGNCVDGSAGRGRSGGKSGSTGGAEQD